MRRLVIATGLLFCFVLLNVAEAISSAPTQVNYRFRDRKNGIMFDVPHDWKVQEAGLENGESDLALVSTDAGIMTIAQISSSLSPDQWFASRRQFYHADLITAIAELSIQQWPVLVIGQPDTCVTAPMLVAILARENEIYQISYYGTGVDSDASAFRTVLQSFSFEGEPANRRDYAAIAGIEFPTQPRSIGCSSEGADNVSQRRICADAAMFIPTEGSLATPFGCIDEAVCYPYESKSVKAYYREPHRGLVIVGSKGDPVYAPYDGVAIHLYHPGDTFPYSLRLQYDAPYDTVESYLTHMGDKIGRSSTITVPDGARVTGGVTQIGYQGDMGTVHARLNISWYKSGTEWDFANTYDPTQFLRAKDLKFISGWQREGPLSCITPPPFPAPPPSVDFFDEEIGSSQLQSDIEWWFPWYDQKSGQYDVIHVANPGTSTATVDVYIGGSRKTQGASIAPGGEWHVTYDGLIGGPVQIVSTNSQPIVASKRTVWEEIGPVDNVSLHLPSSRGNEPGNASSTWWFPWYDSRGDIRNWILVANPGPNFAQVELRIAGNLMAGSPHVIPAGEVWTPNYNDLIDGPVEITSLNEQPIFASQRVLWPGRRSFNEVRGMPLHLASPLWWAPWYDALNSSVDMVHVANPGPNAAEVEVYVAGLKLTSTPGIIPAGGEWHASYENVVGGPLKVVSKTGQPIVVSQRVVWPGSISFDETMAIPSSQLDSTWWFPWYDSKGGAQNWILVANPGSSTAIIDVFAGGIKMSAGVEIPAGGVWNTKYENLQDGPVKIVSSNNEAIIASQRVLWDGDGVFNEVMGVPQALVALPKADKPLAIGELAIFEPVEGDPLEPLPYLQLGIGVNNQLGTWQDTTWDWIVKNDHGTKIQEMSRENVSLVYSNGRGPPRGRGSSR